MYWASIMYQVLAYPYGASVLVEGEKQIEMQIEVQ